MQVILPNNHTLVAEHEMLVQHPPVVQWIDAEQAANAVELLPQRPSFSTWVEWVEQSGGRFATDQELADL